MRSPDEVKFPPDPVVKKRLVDDAVVEKMFVVVALLEVELMAVKFCKVVELKTRRFDVVAFKNASDPLGLTVNQGVVEVA